VPNEPLPTLVDANTVIVDSQRAPEDQDQPSKIGKPEKPAFWNMAISYSMPNISSKQHQATFFS
jgi:hypothetical protein